MVLWDSLEVLLQLLSEDYSHFQETGPGGQALYSEEDAAAVSPLAWQSPLSRDPVWSHGYFPPDSTGGETKQEPQRGYIGVLNSQGP